MNNRQSEFYCVSCGNKGIPLIRCGSVKEPGHLKKLFCLHCNKENNHVEIRNFGKYTYKEFKAEYDNNNFDNEGNRLIPYRQFIGLLKQEGKF